MLDLWLHAVGPFCVCSICCFIVVSSVYCLALWTHCWENRGEMLCFSLDCGL